MNARPELGRNVEIGGFLVRLVCHDPALARRIKAFFQSPRRSGPRPEPSLALTVFPAGTAPGKLGGRPRGQLLDGEGEYVAAFDLAARRGVIRLTGAAPALALANFIRRIFARLVIEHNGAVFHSACVVRKSPVFRRRSESYGGQIAKADGAYIFFGQSGAGKSTVCQLSQGQAIAGHALAKRCAWLRVASDDLTVVRMLGGRLLAWGLPSFQAPPFQLSTGPFPIRAAFTLVQARRNFLRRLAAPAALAGMLAFSSDIFAPGRPPQRGGGRRVPGAALAPSAGVPPSGDPVAKTVDLLARLVQAVPCYELHFKKDPGFWDCIEAELADAGGLDSRLDRE